MQSTNISIDLGSSTTKINKNVFLENRLIIYEIYKFTTHKIMKQGEVFWNYKKIFLEILNGLKIFNEKIDSIAIDAWGCDYALIDKNGKIINNITTYRDKSLENILSTFLIKNKTSKWDLYRKTGSIPSKINTFMQIYRDSIKNPSYLEKTFNILNIPDLFSYMLTGKINNEESIFSTTGMMNFFGNGTNLKYNFLKKLDNINVTNSPTIIGPIKKNILKKFNIGNPKVVLVSSHDTAAAVSSLNMKENDVFLGIGSWSLMGIVRDKPIINKTCFNYDLTNEKSAFGKYKILKNINGLFLIQKLLKSLQTKFPEYTFKRISQEAHKNKKYKLAIDLSDDLFFGETDIFNDIDVYFKKLNIIDSPRNIGQYAMVIYNGLINVYKETYTQLNIILSNKLENVHIFGGGIKDKFLINLIKKELNAKIIIGDVEATSIGNSLQQLIALNIIKKKNILNIKRKVIKNDK